MKYTCASPSSVLMMMLRLGCAVQAGAVHIAMLIVGRVIAGVVRSVRG